MDVYVVDGRGHLVAHSDTAQLVDDPDVSNVEIVRQFLESQGARRRRCPSRSRRRRAVKMLGTYTRVPDDSGWGVIVQVDEEKAYYTRDPDAEPVDRAGGARDAAGHRPRHAVRGPDQPARSRSWRRARGAWPAATTTPG